MMSSSVRVDVVVPYYRGTNADEFEEALESIVSQEYRPLRVLLIRDRSVGAAVSDVVSTYTSIHEDRLRFRDLESPGKGISVALNWGVLNCDAAFIARMDSDDIAHPSRFTQQVEYLINRPAIDAVGSWGREFVRGQAPHDGRLKRLPTDVAAVHRLWHYRNPIIHPSVLMRRRLFVIAGLYDPRFDGAEDLELWGRAMSLGVRVGNIPEVLVYQRVNNLTGRRLRGSAVWAEVRARFEYMPGSFRLLILKLLAVGFRLLPRRLQAWYYHNVLRE